jgi:Cof subfamily protein (haloacid dehalogenase superfamily)
MRSRFYITDLDKTFLRSDLSISEFSVQTWNRLVEEGVKLSIATARSGPKSLELLKDLKLEQPLIVMDGALIISQEGDTLMSNSLDYETVNELLSISDMMNIYPFIIGIDEKGKEKFRHAYKLNALQEELIDQYQTDKRLESLIVLKPLVENIKVVYIGDKEPMLVLKNKICDKFGDQLEVKFQKDIYQDGYFLTVLHPKGDKSHALHSLKSMTNIDFSQMTVFGDSHNDVGMFELVSQKIAVSNAVDEIKTIASHVLKESNDQDAVARYLDQL